ncbi:BAT2 protein [Platysternon megacephalum]|uniref:BAT2 protein n=1 Tax=Platysternon megacephalum TaxID=55544 RepID=A0A4D9DFB1_9SAUR|nr:BAT2 protein [Platysternon megacephalum]
MPTDAKKLELPLGAPACVQKREPAYTYFPEAASLIPNPAFYPEIEPKNQGDSMGPSSVVNKAKDVKVLQDRMQRHLLLAMMQAELRSEVRWPVLFYDKLLQNYKRLNIFMLFVGRGGRRACIHGGGHGIVGGW